MNHAAAVAYLVLLCSKHENDKDQHCREERLEEDTLNERHAGGEGSDSISDIARTRRSKSLDESGPGDSSCLWSQTR